MTQVWYPARRRPNRRGDTGPVRHLPDRAAVLTATGPEPYVRFATAMASGVSGFAGTDSAVLWRGYGPFGQLAHAVGPRPAVDELLRAVGRLDVRWLNLPRRSGAPTGYAMREQWNFRWSTREPPPTPGTDRVVEVEDAAALNGLLDVAMPGSELRPGHPMVHAWYGIWVGPDLVACAADRSTRTEDRDAGTVGVIGAVAVHPGHRRRGLGAAVSAGVAGRLRARYELVTLGVTEGNDEAARVYARLGFTGVAQITSVRPISDAGRSDSTYSGYTRR